jgi:hypothetical protein
MGRWSWLGCVSGLGVCWRDYRAGTSAYYKGKKAGVYRGIRQMFCQYDMQHAFLLYHVTDISRRTEFRPLWPLRLSLQIDIGNSTDWRLPVDTRLGSSSSALTVASFPFKFLDSVAYGYSGLQ